MSNEYINKDDFIDNIEKKIKFGINERIAYEEILDIIERTPKEKIYKDEKTELKPCPLCNYSAKIVSYGAKMDDYYNYWYKYRIVCSNCGLESREETRVFKIGGIKPEETEISKTSLDELIKMWNTRSVNND